MSPLLETWYALLTYSDVFLPYITSWFSDIYMPPLLLKGIDGYFYVVITPEAEVLSHKLENGREQEEGRVTFLCAG